MKLTISHLTDYFIFGKNRDIFTTIGLMAKWAKLWSIAERIRAKDI